MQREVRIRGETINLGQLLKLEGVIGSGAEVKTFLLTEPVWVTGNRRLVAAESCTLTMWCELASLSCA